MRTIIEVLLCAGFALYFLYATGRIWELTNGIAARDEMLQTQTAANYDLLEKFKKLNAAVTRHQDLQRKEIAKMLNRVDVMHAAQVAQSLSN